MSEYMRMGVNKKKEYLREVIKLSKKKDIDRLFYSYFGDGEVE